MIIFRALTQKDLKRIIDLQLTYLVKRTEDQGVVLEFTDRLKETFAKEGYDPVYGARPLKRLLQRKIQDELALLILKGEVREGDVLTVDVDELGNAVFAKKGAKKKRVA